MKPTLVFLGFFILTTILSAQPDGNTSLTWPEITSQNKPWTRWWWQGSSVTKKGITAELDAYAKAGFGGVELTPIYGVRGEEKNFKQFLSSEWMDAFEFTLKHADKLDLGVDMATGTGWPFGGPWVDADQACKNLVYQTHQVVGGKPWTISLAHIQKPLVRTVQRSGIQIDQIAYPIASNLDLQSLAFDQVRFEKQLPLIALVAYAKDGRIVDLFDQYVQDDQYFTWNAPTGEWEVVALYMGWHGKMVERAAPGGEGNVIDHFSKEAIEHYLKPFDRALKRRKVNYLRAYFNDSYEVDDAYGQADWTPKLFTEFESRRGYDLRKHLNSLFEESTNETHLRVRSDFRETISELLLETFTKSWHAWAAKQDALIRNQAHGSPANILDLYAASDIPETEGTDIIKIKFASSAGHVSNRPLIAAEAATWLNEHFLSNLGDLKENIDRYFVGGVNHVVFHGTCYSPPDEVWPGRLFYAAIHANPRNPLWYDLPALNRYIARTQSFLQSGTSDNDLLVYFPIYDRFAESGSEILEHFDGEGRGKSETHFRTLADLLELEGYAYDFISDKQLKNTTSQLGAIQSGKQVYKAIIVPKTKYIPSSTLEKLSTLAQSGVPVFFMDALPESTPGLSIKDSKSTEQFNQFIDFFKKQSTKCKSTFKTLENQLQEVGVKRESLTNDQLTYTRRKHEDGHLYFIANWSQAPIDKFIPIAHDANSVALFDPMSGDSGIANMKEVSGQKQVRLQLNPGQSIILKTYDRPLVAIPWTYIEPKSQTTLLDKDWKVEFIDGGPILPESKTMNQPTFWTDFPSKNYQTFSGRANYSCQFTLNQQLTTGVLLKIADIAESAGVYVNHQYVGTLIGPTFELIIPKTLIKEDNLLEIKVSNLMANRIAMLDRNGVKWKKFYNINFPSRLAENRGDDGLFTAKDWKVKNSGIQGPVTLTILK